jgi:hypothetical protein
MPPTHTNTRKHGMMKLMVVTVELRHFRMGLIKSLAPNSYAPKCTLQLKLPEVFTASSTNLCQMSLAFGLLPAADFRPNRWQGTMNLK